MWKVQEKKYGKLYRRFILFESDFAEHCLKKVEFLCLQSIQHAKKD